MPRFFIILFILLIAYSVRAQTFNGTGGVIPDAGLPACFPISVTGTGTINGNYGLSAVCIDLNHPWDADLEIILKAPDGTKVPLSIQNGGSGANYTNTCFTATAALPISSGVAPFTGAYLPQGYLGNMNNGQNADGVWELCVQDVTADDAGNLLSWNLTFNDNPAPPAPGCSNNTPAGNTCQFATPVCNFNGFCGNTANYTADTWPELTAAFCGGVIENNSFLKFTASSPIASFNVWVTNSLNGLGIQMMVFGGGCGSGAVTSYGCNSRIFPTSTGPNLVTAAGLTPGNTYYLMIDGYLGDVCDYTIVAASGIDILNVTPSSPKICPGQRVSLTANGGNGVYSWAPSAGLNATSGSIVTAQPDTTTTYSITSTPSGSCALIAQVTVTVNPAPAPGPDKIINICIGNSANLDSEFVLSGLTSVWTKNGLPVAHPAAATDTGVYRLVTTNSYGCVDTSFLTLYTVPKPMLGADKGFSICPDNSFNLTTQFSTAGLTTYWTLSGSSVAVPNTVNTGGNYQLVAFNGSSCSDTSLLTLTIDPKPDLGLDKIVNLCPGTAVDLSDLFSTTGFVTSWTKAGIPVSNITNVSSAGVYQLIVSNGATCTDTALVTISINPSLNLGADTAVAICAGNTLDFFSVYNTSGITAEWTFGGVPVSDPASVNTVGIYRLIAISGATCRDTAYLTLSSNPKPDVGVDKVDTICASPINLNSQFNTAGLILDWTLNGDPVSAPTAAIDSGLYRLIASTAAGCMDTGFLQLTVKPRPDLGSNTTQLNCAGVEYNLTAFYNTSGLTANWTFGGLPVMDPTLISAPGVYQLIASNLNGCSDTALFIINTFARPDLGGDQDIHICTGQTADLTRIYNTSGLNTDWTLGNVPVLNPTVVSTAGMYQLIASKGLNCRDTALVTVIVNPKANLGYDKSAYECAGTPINLTNQFITTGLTTSWTFRGLPVLNPFAVVIPGDYRLIGTNIWDCADTAIFTLRNAPVPQLGTDKTVTICPGILFDLTSQFNTTGATSVWSIGGLPVSNPAAVSVAGIYQLVATNPSACSDTALLTLIIDPNLYLGPDTTASLCPNSFADLTSVYFTAGLFTQWTLGGVPVTDPAAVVAPGIYRITANNGGVCSDTALITVILRANPTLGADKIISTCQSIPINLNAQYNTSGLTFNWSSGGINLSPVVAASGLYRIIAANTWGCADTAFITLTVNPQPHFGIDKSIIVCEGTVIDLDSQFSTTGAAISWTHWGLPVINPSAVTDTGTFRIIAVTPFNCADTAELVINHLAKPKTGNDTTIGVCSGSTFDLTQLYDSVFSNIWTSAGIVVGDPSSINTTGIYQLIAAYNNGCADTVLIYFVVNPKPLLGLDKIINLCPGSSVGLSVQYNTVGLTSVWTFGADTVLNPSAVVIPGLYQLIATSAAGCMDTAFVDVVSSTKPSLGGDKKITTCPGTVTDLTTQYNTSGLPVAWTYGGMPVADPAAVTASGMYQLIAGNNSGCSDTASVTIIFWAKPAAGPDRFDSTCMGNFIDLYNLFDTTALNSAWTIGGVPVSDPSAVTTAGIYQLIIANSFGCLDTALVQLFIKLPTSSTETISICANQLPYTWNGNSLSSAGVFKDTLVNAGGCDSVITINLSVRDTSTSITDISVCNNLLPYSWNGNSYAVAGSYEATLVNAAGCDSVAKLNLNIKDTSTSSTSINICSNQLPYSWNGNSYGAAGIYQARLVNAAGCDSIATINLAVQDTITSTSDISICRKLLPFNWNGNNYSAGGTYEVTLINAAGCDSIATLNLSIADSSFSNSDTSICPDQFPFGWNGNSYAAPGVYTVTLVNATGCDSIATLALTSKQTSTSATDVRICSNQLPYGWNGNTYTTGGIYNVNLINFAGCDSVAVLNLIVRDTSSSITNISICANQLPFSWNGNSYAVAGVYSLTLINAAGCDSAATLELSVKDTSISTTTQSVCSNQLPFNWNGNNYAAGGVYTITLVNAAGCDSVATLNLTVKDTSISLTDQRVCANGLPYTWNSNTYTAAGLYSVTLANAAGCDSVATLNLVVTDTSFSHTDTSICAAQFPFSWNGNSYPAAGDYTITLVNASGCDSVATLHLVSKQASSSITDVRICPNFLPYNWNGNNYTAGGIYSVTLVNAAGCDSVATLNLVIKDTSSSNTTVSICANQLPYSWNSNSYISGGIYIVTLINNGGCDSIAVLNLVVKDTSSSNTSVSICANQLPYSWNGNNYATAGTYQVILVNAVGCDSAASLNLLVKDTTSSLTNVAVCPNQLPYRWNGNDYPAGGSYAVTLTNSQGCDSIARLILMVKNNSSSTTTVSICPGQLPYSWNGNNYTAADTYTTTFTNAAGCDSVATLHLIVRANSSSTVNKTVCANELPVQWNNGVFAEAGSYTATLTNAAGCDSVVTLLLAVNPVPAKPFIGNDTLICPGDEVVLNAGIYDTYLWQNNSVKPSFTVSEAGNYWVQVGDSSGCKNADSISVSFLANCDDIYFPNAFTPNNDGLNDKFGPLGNLFLVSNYSLQVYNKLGQLIFDSSNPYIKWDGNVKGKAAVIGGYTWRANYLYKGLRKKRRSGNLMLIR